MASSNESRSQLAEGYMPLTIDCDQCQNTIVFDRGKDKRYKNWIHATLCIQWTKEALELLVEYIANQIHADLRPALSKSVNCCKLEDFQKDTHICKLCKELKKKILKLYTKDARTFKWNVSLTIKQIHDSEMNVFKLFLRGKFVDCTSIKEADCTAFLSFLESTQTGIDALHGGINLFEVRTARNKLMHSGTMIIETEKLVEYGTCCLEFLENVTHPPGEAKDIADKKYNDIKKIIEKQIIILFATAEEIAMEHIHSHAKVEVEILQKEIESGDLSSQDLRQKKEELLRIKDGLIKRGAVMEVMNMPSTNTDDVKTLVEEVEDVYKKAEKKQNDHSTKFENLQSNIFAKLETVVAPLRTGLDTLQEKVARLEQHNRYKHRQKPDRTPGEGGGTFKTQQPQDTSKLPRKPLMNNASTILNKSISRIGESDDQDMLERKESISKEDETKYYKTKNLSDKSLENDEEDDVSETRNKDTEQDQTTDIVKPSRSSDSAYYGNREDADGVYDIVCKSVHDKLKQLHESDMIPKRENIFFSFPLSCKKKGCVCSSYSDLLWSLSRLAYHTFVSDGDEEESTPVVASHPTFFGMSKQDFESSKLIGILGFTNELENIIAKKDLTSVYFVDSKEKCFFAAFFLSFKQKRYIVQKVCPKLFSDTRSIIVNADILQASAYFSPILAMCISQYMMRILSGDDKIQEYRKTLSYDSHVIIYKIQTLLISAFKEILHKKDSGARLYIRDIIVLPANVSIVVSALRGMNIEYMKSVHLLNLDSKETTQIFQILNNIPFIKMTLVNCEVDKMSVGCIVRDSLCILELCNLSMSHDLFGEIIRHLSALKLLKFMGLQNLACSDHGQMMDECEGLVVDFTGSHMYLEAVWITNCKLSYIVFNQSAKQLQLIHISDVKTTDTCLKSFWKSLPPRSVDIWLRDVTIVLSGRSKNIIDEMRQSKRVTITLDGGDKEINGNLFVSRFELKKTAT